MAVKQESWVQSANDPGSDFPLQNLPYGVFCCRGLISIGVAIGDQVLDLKACATQQQFASLSEPIVNACRAETLGPLMALGQEAWSALRRGVTSLLAKDSPSNFIRDRIAELLIPRAEVEMRMPVEIGDYSDFYASIDHAMRVGKLFRPDNPLLPNYKYVPIGYHGRASSIVISGSEVQRPSGQIRNGDDPPRYAPTCSLDYELEVGGFVGTGNPLGTAIPIGEAEGHIFGLCLVNDWSARDMQAWEYQPLGPFLAKSFATTISPWIVPLEALDPYRVPARVRPVGDPAPLRHLSSLSAERDGIDLHLEVYLQSKTMREGGVEPCLVSQGNLRDLYWTLRQLVTHHTSNGCNLRTGDLLATGTVSGPNEGSEGCMLEMKHRSTPLNLRGDLRTFLEDGDRVVFRAYAKKDGLPRIGFGDCAGTIVNRNLG